ncbi:unnamed protein product [Dicrocoelium dendriticum]|nr:unnamed protein product [Dicrocoelium dendriticum]
MAAPRSIADPEINYVCLPNELKLLETGAECHAIGWDTGHVNSVQSLLSRAGYPSSTHHIHRTNADEWTPDKLRQVNLTVLMPQACKKHYKDLREQMIICAASKGKESCTRDSGSGLCCQLPKNTHGLLLVLQVLEIAMLVDIFQEFTLQSLLNKAGFVGKPPTENGIGFRNIDSLLLILHMLNVEAHGVHRSMKDNFSFLHLISSKHVKINVLVKFTRLQKRTQVLG